MTLTYSSPLDPQRSSFLNISLVPNEFALSNSNYRDLPFMVAWCAPQQNLEIQMIVGKAVETALKAGYRHIDCAWIYGNQAEIGETLKHLFSSDYKQEQIQWPDKKAKLQKSPVGGEH
ncbi:unnamed protein product [Strongylus vulgaris]|uniref:NADP-dependent oxidoreductase domain-containing protein n=1 Tax=Strongylus vulgaris TaxID=40348 RepID=A0A3P7L1Z6_STRVU|nr:unnamed protein product [Strongylus vulgaris]